MTATARPAAAAMPAGRDHQVRATGAPGVRGDAGDEHHGGGCSLAGSGRPSPPESTGAPAPPLRPLVGAGDAGRAVQPLKATRPRITRSVRVSAELAAEIKGRRVAGDLLADIGRDHGLTPIEVLDILRATAGGDPVLRRP